jgi:hypothetical protein
VPPIAIVGICRPFQPRSPTKSRKLSGIATIVPNICVCKWIAVPLLADEKRKMKKAKGMSGSAVYIATPKKRSGEVQPDCSDCPGVLYGNKTLLFTDEVNRIILHKLKSLPVVKGFKGCHGLIEEEISASLWNHLVCCLCEAQLIYNFCETEDIMPYQALF